MSKVDLFEAKSAEAKVNYAIKCRSSYLPGFSENVTKLLFFETNKVEFGSDEAELCIWNTAYNWGNHAGLYPPVGYVPEWNKITGNPFSIANPVIDHLLKSNGINWINFTPNFLSAEVDGDITNEIQTLWQLYWTAPLIMTKIVIK